MTGSDPPLPVIARTNLVHPLASATVAWHTRDMNTAADEMTEAQYEMADSIELWLESHPGMHSPSVIARGIKAETVTTQDVLRWMERNVFVVADGNGAWRKYGAR